MSLTFAPSSPRLRIVSNARSGGMRSAGVPGGVDGRPHLRVVRPEERLPAARVVRRTRPVRLVRPVRPVARAASRRRPPLRLTRRGRLVVHGGGLLLAGVAVVAGVLLLTHPAEAGTEVGRMAVSYHTVLPGETLWGLAGELDPRADRGDTVAAIMELNALSDPAVAAGQRIALPDR